MAVLSNLASLVSFLWLCNLTLGQSDHSGFEGEEGETRFGFCNSYRCMKRFEREGQDELDRACRSLDSPFCYCCGGKQIRLEASPACRRFCLEAFKKEDKTLVENCRLKPKFQELLDKRNDQLFQPVDDLDSLSNVGFTDGFFPDQTIDLAPIEEIECDEVNPEAKTADEIQAENEKPSSSSLLPRAGTAARPQNTPLNRGNVASDSSSTTNRPATPTISAERSQNTPLNRGNVASASSSTTSRPSSPTTRSQDNSSDQPSTTERLQASTTSTQDPSFRQPIAFF